MLILFTSRYKVTNNNFYLAVFKTGINILVKIPVILFGIVKVFGKAVPACFLSRSEVSNYAFADREALEKEIDKVKELDLWKDKTFEEVSIEELKEKGKAGKVEQEKSTEYIKPSELVATEVAAKALPVSMKGRGSESLTRMSDRETLARAEGYYAKDSKFADLYVGKNVMKNIERSESGLMLRLAMFCGNDEEQLLRIFKSSGQFRDEKPNAYYMKLASESMKTIREMRGSIAAAQENNGFTKGKIGINSKR